jgi:hypothetical protein
MNTVSSVTVSNVKQITERIAAIAEAIDWERKSTDEVDEREAVDLVGEAANLVRVAACLGAGADYYVEELVDAAIARLQQFRNDYVREERGVAILDDVDLDNLKDITDLKVATPPITFGW